VCLVCLWMYFMCVCTCDCNYTPGRFVVQRVAQSGDPYVYVATALHDVLGDDGTRR